MRSRRSFANGASRARTGDLLGAIQALSQLSYSPARRSVARVGLATNPQTSGIAGSQAAPAYRPPNASAETPRGTATTGRLLPIPVRFSSHAAPPDNAAIDTAVPAAKMNSAATAALRPEIEASSSNVTAALPPTPWTTPIANACNGVRGVGWRCA